MSGLFRIRRATPPRGPLTAVRIAPAAPARPPEPTIWDDLATATGESPLRASATPVGNAEVVNRTPLQGTLNADVCVIGLGITGLTAAHTLAQAGAHVIGVNADAIGSGNSSRTSGIARAGLPIGHHRVVALLGRRRAAAIYRATLKELDLMARVPGEFTRTGAMLRADDEDAFLVDEIAALQRDGFPIEGAAGGAYREQDGIIDPLGRTLRVANEAREAGAQLFSHVQAQQVAERGTFSATGEVQCRMTIVAVDAGLEDAMPALAPDVQTQVMRAAASHPVETCGSYPVIDARGRHHWFQLPSGQLVAQHGPVSGRAGGTPAESHALLDDRVTATVLGVDATATITQRWSVASGFTANGLPRVARLGATIAVGGYNGANSVLGPMLGRAAAELALGRKSRIAKLLSP